MEKIRGVVIKGKDVKTSDTYEYPVIHQHGIEASTVEFIDPPFTMTHIVKPPGGVRGRAHLHLNCARAQLILKGHLRVFFGPEWDQQVFDLEPGDYVYCPKGLIHSSQNLSSTEPVEWAGVYIGVTSREESGKIYVEPPRK